MDAIKEMGVVFAIFLFGGIVCGLGFLGCIFIGIMFE